MTASLEVCRRIEFFVNAAMRVYSQQFETLSSDVWVLFILCVYPATYRIAKEHVGVVITVAIFVIFISIFLLKPGSTRTV